LSLSLCKCRPQYQRSRLPSLIPVGTWHSLCGRCLVWRRRNQRCRGKRKRRCRLIHLVVWFVNWPDKLDTRALQSAVHLGERIDKSLCYRCSRQQMLLFSLDRSLQ
jgi:hypothetical protein